MSSGSDATSGGDAMSAPTMTGTVVGTRTIDLQTGPIEPGKIAQIAHSIKFAGRLVGARSAAGGRITRILADGITALQRPDDARSWRTILESDRVDFITGRSAIVVVKNETAEPRRFQLELEVEPDPSLEPPAPTSGSAGSPTPAANRPLPPGAAPDLRSAAAPDPRARAGGAWSAGYSAVDMEARPPPRPSGEATDRSSPSPARSDEEQIHLVLDRNLCERVALLLNRRMPLGVTELGRIVAAFDQGRVRRDPPNARFADVVVTVSYGLLRKLYSVVRQGTRLHGEDLAVALAAFSPPPRAGSPSGSPAATPASAEPSVETTIAQVPSPSSEIGAEGERGLVMLSNVDAVAVEACATALDRLSEDLRSVEPSAEAFRRGVEYGAAWLRSATGSRGESA